jgi:arylsulfatase A-like enzyme
MMSKLVRILLVVFAAAAVRSTLAVEVRRPNLVFILTDDLRWNTLGCMGDEVVRTPNIDRLAARGVLFRNSFVATSICCVSRASIFTGQHERRHGIGDFRKPLTPAQWAETYPALLRPAGYRTGFVGKFGVGDAAAVKAMAAKFDFWRGLPGQAGEFFIDPKDPTHTHATAKFGDQSLEFLQGCDGKKPFCLSLSFNAPHARDGKPREFQPDLRDESLYATDLIPMPLSANEEFFKRLPKFVQHSEGRRRWEHRFATDEMFQRTMRDYERLVTGIDREVGRIVEALAAQHLDNNTVIIFTSDNGWFAGDRQLAGKWLMYEESIRVPLVIFDPRLPETRRGGTVDAITLNTDFAPTMLEMAGVPVPARMQGHSLVPLLAGQKQADWRTEFFYEHHYAPDIIPPSEGVRTERWSYIHWLPPNPEREELYDVQADPLEAHNLAADPRHAATLAELRSHWQKSLELLK